jgi:hypothetical protein
MYINTLSIYKISFKKILTTYSTITEVDLDKIASLDIESSFDYEKDGLYYCYVITTEIEINKYKKILEKNLINFTCEDVSDIIIKNDYDISYIKNYLDDDNHYIYEIFLHDLNCWIYSKLDIDIILDMISFKGIDSLRQVDKKFLKDYESK